MIMAPVAVKHIVSFSSEDPRHKVENLLSADERKSWLCDTADRSGQLEVELQLERVCALSYIDIGNCGCFSVKILVGRSSWPQGRAYKTLMPAASLMTPVMCRTGTNRNKIAMFKAEEHFDSAVSGQTWDRVRIVCTQPFRKDRQFGLVFVRFRTLDSADAANVGASPTASSLISPDDAERAAHKTSSIKKHFFSETDNERRTKDEHLKSRLLKMAGNENGSEVGNHDVLLSRTAKMVLHATNRSPGYSVKSTTKTHESQRSTPQTSKASKQGFEGEVEQYLNSLNLHIVDIDKVTFADLRHKLEKQKCRKLTKEEKKIFFSHAVHFVDNHLGKGNSDSKDENTDSTRTNNAAPPPRKRLDLENQNDCRIQTNKTSFTDNESSEVNKSHTRSSTSATSKSRKNQRLTDDNQGVVSISPSNFAQSRTTPTVKRKRKIKPALPLHEQDTNDTWLQCSPGGSVLTPSGADKVRSSGTQAATPTSSRTKSATPTSWRTKSNTPTSSRVKSVIPASLTQTQTKPRNGDVINLTLDDYVPVGFQKCPICLDKFSLDVIAIHAANCRLIISSSDSDNDSSTPVKKTRCSYDTVYTDNLTDRSKHASSEVACPLCQNFYSADVIEIHASQCGGSLVW